MRKYLIILLLSTSFLMQYACVSLKGYEKGNTSQNISAVLNDGYKTALYKASFDLGEKHYSGLFYFKLMPDTSHRIVFLSEIGLNIMDLEYKKGNFKVISCQEFMNKATIINALQNDLKLLIDLPNMEKQTSFKSTTNDTLASVLKVKDKEGKFYYFTTNNKITKIVKTKGIGHTETIINGYKNNLPQKIEMIHKKIKLSIKLNQIEVK